MPETRSWSSSCRLIAEPRRRTRATTSSRSKSGSSGSRPMWAISGGSTAPPVETISPPNIRWSTKCSAFSVPEEARDEPSRRAAAPSRRRRTRRCFSVSASAGWTSIWPLIPRWHSSASPSSRGSQRYLPRRLAPVIVRPASASAKPSGPRGSRRTGRSWRTSTATTRAPTTWRSRPARTTSTSGSSGTAAQSLPAALAVSPEVVPSWPTISPYAVSAAACSASFFDRPLPLP